MRNWAPLAIGLLAALLLLLVACIPSGDRWFELMPGNEGLEVTYDTWCLGPAEPEFEEAIQFWNGTVFVDSYMEGVFRKRSYPPCGQVRMVSGGWCPPGALACVSLQKNADGYLARATIRLPGKWYLSSPEWKRAAMHHEIGHVMGLDEFYQSQCKPHPYSSFLTIMGTAERWPFPPCLTEPAMPDVIGSVCYNYGYQNNPYGPDCPDLGFSGGGVGVASSSLPDHDIDGVSDAYDSDDDNDTFSDADEAYMGTDALDNCPDNSQHDAWPPDFDQSRVVNIIDLNNLLPPPLGSWGTSLGDPDYSARSDLVPDGVINILDLNKMMPPPLGFWGQTCVSTESQIVDTIKATEKYRDVQVAKDEGFVQATQPIPGRGALFINADIWDDTFDMEQPEGLMYEGERLLGVFYFMPLWAVPDPPEGFIGSGDVWATHYGFCITENGETIENITEEQCSSSGGMFYWDEIGHLLSAWLFEYNPDGVFQEVNPNVD